MSLHLSKYNIVGNHVLQLIYQEAVKYRLACADTHFCYGFSCADIRSIRCQALLISVHSYSKRG